jgi:hypothetical protein
MRICSFLPSATEMIAELGFIDSLVGVSEECRWPPEVIGKPIVTAAKIDPSKMSSLEIDEAVRASVREGRSRSALPCPAVAVDGDAYYSRPAPRLAAGVQQLAHLIHPDVAPDPGLPEIPLGTRALAPVRGRP